ncbi:MAG TPA: hypothetical protein PLP29_16270 [Candidatus Ozemobacteraceae bacterium]|nr:hypothetical protein [Candidatus Ozemobacteraceae bacterium]
MEVSNRSGLRELQIAQGLVALRWAAIPILFGFALMSTRLLGMSFQITPIYVLCCLLACINVYFTVHISMLTRQVALRHGVPALRRLLNLLLSRHIGELRTNATRAFTVIPRLVLKLMSTVYLLVLEMIRGIRFNLLSLDNVMHTQVIVDLIMITLLVRYTGSPESPLMMLTAIPIIVAGAVLGFHKGALYAGVTGGGYLLLCLLVHFKLIMHIKFYGPQFGDLSMSLGWAVASFAMIVVALLGTAYLAHNLTSIFKERIYYLQQLLNQSRRDNVAQGHVADNVTSAWFILDAEGTVLKYRRGRSGLIGANLAGRNLLESIPAFKQYGMGYVMQSVLTGGRAREIERIRVQSSEGLAHTFTCRLIPMTGESQEPLILLLTDDLTEPLFLKDRVEELKQALDTTRVDLEKATLDGKELNQQLMKSLKQANERTQEIDRLTQQIRGLETARGDQENQMAALMTELACVKSSNDALTADITYKQMILEEVTELLKNCTHLETLSSMIERRTKALFKLEDACLHIFRSPNDTGRLNEILDTRKAPPRLLDMPRRNPKLLEPVLADGQPVVIKAEVHPEKSATVEITNGPIQRMIAYIPIRHESELLGMMMLDRFGSDENPEKMLSMLTYYLSHTAIALKNAILSQNLESQRQSLTSTMSSLESTIAGLMDMVRLTPGNCELPFQTFLKTLGKLCGASDAAMFRANHDGTIQPLGRLDTTRKLEMRSIEEKVFKALQTNPAHKATVKDPVDGSILISYPLNQGAKLIGSLFIQMPDAAAAAIPVLDIGSKLASDHLTLMVLNEEKELWENFYRENLVA